MRSQPGCMIQNGNAEELAACKNDSQIAQSQAIHYLHLNRATAYMLVPKWLVAWKLSWFLFVSKMHIFLY